MTHHTANPPILIIDDTGDAAAFLRDALAADFELSVVPRDQAAAFATGEPPPWAILVNLAPDTAAGHALCRRLANPGPPVIAVALGAPAGDEVAAFEAGAADVLRHSIPALARARVHHHVRRAMGPQRQEAMRLAHWLGHGAEFREDDSGRHVVRVSSYARRLGLAAGMDEDTVELLAITAPLHDIGKVGIPDHILLKPGHLDPDEWEIMKTHTTLGARIIGTPDTPLARMALDVVLTHHERWDGTGYPKGLTAADIPLAGRVMAIVDVFDALTSSRPYKEAWPLDKAVALIKREAGTLFDPELVRRFGAIMNDMLNVRLQFGEHGERGTSGEGQ
ncbi:MAG: HD domain-containing protein [Gammaproteobacteria bacterium]|nr:HD domain-containing protein [Gammaproteobacteria bacterium]